MKILFNEFQIETHFYNLLQEADAYTERIMDEETNENDVNILKSYIQEVKDQLSLDVFNFDAVWAIHRQYILPTGKRPDLIVFVSNEELNDNEYDILLFEFKKNNAGFDAFAQARRYKKEIEDLPENFFARKGQSAKINNVNIVLCGQSVDDNIDILVSHCTVLTFSCFSDLGLCVNREFNPTES